MVTSRTTEVNPRHSIAIPLHPPHQPLLAGAAQPVANMGPGRVPPCVPRRRRQPAKAHAGLGVGR
jgi:hypothetical protein